MEGKPLSTATMEAKKSSCLRLRHYVSQTSTNQSMVSGLIPRENYRGTFWTQCPDFEYLKKQINQSNDVAITCEDDYITHISTNIDTHGKINYKLYSSAKSTMGPIF